MITPAVEYNSEIVNMNSIKTFQWQSSKFESSTNDETFHSCMNSSHDQCQIFKNQRNCQLTKKHLQQTEVPHICTALVESNSSYFSQVALQCDCGRRKETAICTEAASSYRRSVSLVYFLYHLNYEYEVIETSLYVLQVCSHRYGQ